MTKYLTTDSALKNVADTIRAKGKTTEQLIWPSGYNTAINAISAIDLCVSSSSPTSMAVVDDAANVNAKRVVVDIEPVQDLHGYDNPWPAGGGKNLFDNTGYNESVSGLTISLNEQGLFVISGVLAQDYAAIVPSLNITDLLMDGQTYTLSMTDYSTQCVYIQIVAIRANSTKVYYTAAFNSRTFTVNKSTFVAYEINFQSNTTEVWGTNSRTIIVGGQLESGATATSWSPYSNVCPITGWTGAQVTRTGINVWDEEWVRGTIDWNTRKITPDAQGARICSKNFTPVKSGRTYYINYQHFGNAVFGYADEYANGVDISVPDSTKLCTIPAGIQFIKFAALISDYGSDTYQNDISINYPATDTQYHPYTGNQISVTFPSAAGTVYGGTLDVTNGVLTVDRAMVTFNGGSSEQWWLAQDYTNRFGNNNTGTFCDGIIEHQISNWLKSSSWGNKSFTFGLRSNGSLYICLDASAEQITEAQFRAYLASTPLQIVYTLATPVIYNLTPQDIELLSGYNVIFADCGDVALSYYTEDFIDLADEIGFAEGGDY